MEKSLYWHQGLFLQPQHLQLKDLYDQSLFTPYHAYLKPFLHGVVSIEIQESSLSADSFEIESGSFWFPDMTYVELWKNAVIESRRLSELWQDKNKPLMVYVGLKKNSSGGDNVQEIEAGESTGKVFARFVVNRDPEQVNDLHKGGAPAQIKRMNYLLKVFSQWDLDQLGNYDLIPVARIIRKGNDIRLAQNFVPPCVTLSASPILDGMAKDIGNKLSFRGLELEAHKKKRGIHAAEFGSRDMTYILALRSFNRYIPFFKQLEMNYPVHPFDAYQRIRQLVGEMSSFSEKINVDGIDDEGKDLLPKYDHQNLWTCFSKAKILVATLLDEITAGPEYVVPLSRDDSCYSCVMKSEYMEGDSQYYLVMRTDEDVKEVLDAIDIGVKVCSLKLLPIHIQRALPGAKIDFLPVPPQELPKHRNAKYFRIDNHGEQWAHIEKDKTLGVHWDNPPEDLTVELMVVRRR